MGTRTDEERVSAAIAAQVAFIERLGDIRGMGQQTPKT